MLNGACFLQPAWERLTCDDEFLFWATPTCMDGMDPKTDKAIERERTETRKGRSKFANLRDQVVRGKAMFPTPRATEHKGGYSSQGGGPSLGRMASMWDDRIRPRDTRKGESMETIKEMKIADLKSAPYNPRTIKPEALAGLKESIKRFGLVQPIVWNRRTKRVVSGHQRIEALKKLGEKMALVLEIVLIP